jgi:transcriptional regulator with XRE-family HTH domain
MVRECKAFARLFTMSVKLPNPVDKYVGNRVRMRRLMLNMSQEALANQLGLTFQQVQKYEKGTNRVSASRLQQMSHILQVPIPFFFEGAPQTTDRGTKDRIASFPTYVSEFLATTDGIALAGAFMNIPRGALRHCVVRLVEEIAENESEV